MWIRLLPCSLSLNHLSACPALCPSKGVPLSLLVEATAHGSWEPRARPLVQSLAPALLPGDLGRAAPAAAAAPGQGEGQQQLFVIGGK